MNLIAGTFMLHVSSRSGVERNQSALYLLLYGRRS
jgi:hypothetical protein